MQIIDSLPGNSYVSKAAIMSAGTGLTIAAISNELYVYNEETIIMVSLLTVYWAIWKWGGPYYSSWAKGHQEKINGILNGARESHKQAVKDRITSVEDLGSVIDTTKNLFEVSKVWSIYSCA
jgi:F-type H+-transporting ATPase subunit b